MGAARRPYPRGAGASRLGAAAPFVSVGRGAAPSGLLTSGRAVAVSRRCGAASPQGVGRRRRAVPTLGETWGASRHGAAAPFVSIGRGSAPSGPHFHCGLPSRSREADKLEPDFFMRMGHGRLSEPEASRPCHSARISSFPNCGPVGIRGYGTGNLGRQC